MNKKRLFFALWPNDRQRDRLRDFITPVAKLVEGRMIDRRNWHVTLVFIGDFEEARVPELSYKASQIDVEPFHLRFNRLEFWARPKVAALMPATIPPELERLHAAVTGVLQDSGILTEDRAFRPHITVVRQARPFETQRLAQQADTEWSSFELVESVSQPGGVSYHPLKQ